MGRSGLNNRDGHSQSNFDSDCGRVDALSRRSWKNPDSGGLCRAGALPRVYGCTTEVSPKIQETGHYQLKKSDKPYRPPHTYKVCNVNFEADNTLGKTTSVANTCCDYQEKKQSEMLVSIDKQHETKNLNFPIVSDSNKGMEPSSAEKVYGDGRPPWRASAQEQELIDCDADKVIEGLNMGMASQGHSTFILENVASAAKVDSCGASTLVEKRASPYLATFTEFKLQSPDGHSAFKVESCSSVKTLEGNNGNSDKNQTVQPTFEMDFMKEVQSNEASFSVQRGSGDGITENDALEPCDFPFTVDDQDFFTSILKESGAIGMNHEGVKATGISEKTESDMIEDNQSAFDNALAKISTILQMEELMLSSVAKCDNTADSEVEICLPDEDSLISIDYLTLSEHSHSLPEMESVLIESGSSVLDISREENFGNSRKNQTVEPSFGTYFRKEVRSNEASFSVQGGSVDRITRNDTLELCESSLTVEDEHFLIWLLNGSGAFGTNHKSIGATSTSEKTGSDKIEEDQSAFDDAWARISAILRMEKESKLRYVAECDDIADSEGEIHLPDDESLISIQYLKNFGHSKSMPEIESVLQMQQDSKLNPVSGCDEKAELEAEICWPDEDSLIAIDYLLVPECSEFMCSGNSVENDMLTSNMKIDIAEKSTILYSAQHDERSMEPGLEGPPPPDVVGMGTACHNLHPQQSYPMSHQAQMNFKKSSSHSLQSHQAQMSFQTKLMDPKVIQCTPLVRRYSYTDVNPRPLQKTPPAKTKGLDHLVQYSLWQQPTIFSPQLLRRTALLDPIEQMACSTQELNPGQCYLPFYSQQPTYQSFGIPNPDLGVIRGYNDRTAFNRFMDMGVEATQTNSSAVDGQAQESYDTRFWYRR
ncbi:unnamed protein product [Ilex paraguariensis]|uniref:Uncharacterized protein n=1 Tax=Ilex paraguariensis TaxID=185542 RepID=A0ABC8UVI4_9AQUA